MKRRILIVCGFILFTLGVNGQSVVINKIFNNTNTAAGFGGSVNGNGDAIELLVLEDHADLRGVYVKESYNITSAPIGIKEGAIWQFTDHELWADLRAGTTIQLVRPPLATAPQPVLDVDVAGDNHILIPLLASSSTYLISIVSDPTVDPPQTWNFNLQARDVIAVKRGNTAYGYDDLLHVLMMGYGGSDQILKTQFDNIISDKKVLTDNTLTGTTSNNGIMFFRTPTAETAPHQALNDYLGVDNDNERDIIGWVTTNDAPAWGTGQTNSGSQNANFISYLRASPKIESITLTPALPNSTSIVYTVVFNKDVTNVTAADFSLGFTGTAQASVGEITGSGTTYTVTLTDLSGAGTVKLVKRAIVGITDGTNIMFNGFVYDKADAHTTDLPLAPLKPNAPIIEGLDGGIITNVRPKLSGNVIPNATVNLYKDGVKVNATITSDANGDWSYDYTSALSAGQHIFHITITISGVNSPASDAVSVNLVPFFPGNPATARSVVINKMYNSNLGTSPANNLGMDDVVELLVLEDHTDLRNFFIKDQAGGSNSADYDSFNDNGGKYKFRNIPLWGDLRSGTTIVLRRLPSAASGYVLDTDPTDLTLDVSLDDPAYFENVSTSSFNLQNYDLVILKGGNSPLGQDNLVHAFIGGVITNSNTDLRPAFNAFPESKLGITSIVPTVGHFYVNNPVGGVTGTQHLAITDYSGFQSVSGSTTATGAYTPDPPIVKTSFSSSTAVPAYHIGELGSNRNFQTYLKAAPKIDSIMPYPTGDETSVMFRVYFNKNVTGVDELDFQLTSDESSNGIVAQVTGSGAIYEVLVNELSGNGNLYLVKKASGTGIADDEERIIFYGFTYKSDPYYVTGLPVNIPTPEAPIVVGAQDGSSNIFMPVIRGYAMANVKINLYVDDVLLDVNITSDADGNWSYKIPSPLVQGDHSFYITVTTSYGTSSPSDVVTVNFKRHTGVITVNNVLTPNGDGKNDYWYIDNLDMYPNNEVVVFDKTGKVVFQQQNYMQDWDGTSIGKPLSPGTYYYQVTFGPDLKPLKGYLTIIR